MKRNIIKWTLSTLGITSAAFSLILLFSGVAKAVCTISISCPNGGIVSCSGDRCQHSSNSVTCRDNAGTTTTYCPSNGGGGGGYGGFEP